MENVTGKWRFRDGREVVAVYENGRELLGIWNGGYGSMRSDCWKVCENASDLIPVDPEPAYRPFRDLKEAFRVMGPVFWLRGNSNSWFVPTWNAEHGRIDGKTLREIFACSCWTNDPSDKTGKPCGVEVTQ